MTQGKASRVMSQRKQKLELTWIGKEHRPKLEPRVLLEDAAKSYHAAQRVTERDQFDNRLIFGDNLLALKALEQEFTGQIKEAKRGTTLALTLEEKLAGQKQIKALEGQRNTKRKSLFEAQDEIDLRRERLIADIEGKLAQNTTHASILSMRWRLA